MSWGGARANSGGARAGAGRPRKTPELQALADRDQWFCVKAQPGMNLVADINLRRSAFTVFNPSIFVQGKPARRSASGAMRPAIPDGIVPMFGRFFFVSTNATRPEWREIPRTQGVHSVVGAETGGRPWPIPDGQVALVRELLEPNDCMYPEGYFTHRHRAPELVGTAQRILTGVLEGEAGICEWSEARRLRLLMRMFGRDNVPVTVTRDETETVLEGALAA